VDDDGFDTPQEAALAEWASLPAAQARVESCEVVGDEAWVVIDTNPRHRDKNYCLRSTTGKWWVAASGGSLRTSETRMAESVRQIPDSGD